MSRVAGEVLIVVGTVFNIIGCIGIVRLPDIYNRLQAGTKCVTLGTCLVLLGTMLMAGSTAIALKALVCMVFVLVTSPTAAHALARGAHAFGVKLWSGSVVDRYREDDRPGIWREKES